MALSLEQLRVRGDSENEAVLLAEQARVEHHATMEAEARERGFQSGYEEGLRAAEAEWTDRLSVLAEVVQRLEADAAHRLEGVEDDIVAITFEATVRLVGSPRLTLKRVTTIVEDILRQRPSPEPLSLHLSPDDYERLVTEPLFAALEDDKKRIKLIEDPSVASGGCRAYTAYGILDCSLESRLDEIKKILLEARAGLTRR